MITASDVLVRTERHVSAPLGEEVAMLDIDSGSYYLLDDIATVIWARLAEPTPVTSILAEIQELYDVTPEQCDSDVRRFLGDLLDKDLVRHVE